MSQTMNSIKPYLLRAIYEWISDNNCTHHLLVNTEYPYVDVPKQFINKGQIVFNISPMAVKNFLIDEYAIQFDARFGGILKKIYIPLGSIKGLFAKENGQGMPFPEEDPIPPQSIPEPSAPSSTVAFKKPLLKIVRKTDS